ncbi:quinon protein alcohol dehydrogenase-like superfamily [Apodospora peruviana]|uniref:Quinon protein alcohol dehydrogenase-like superfamily n=1 Tax=Apodospora peruviana TaxID=516989 RepID=A0AAE0ME52_9PEZI|nr:quinon protein alcohol dehydrogenase-like superfamily [Apodospora peruviana]
MLLHALVGLLCLFQGVSAGGVIGSSSWSGWGANTRNNRWASQNNVISSANILSVADTCTKSFPIGISATPVISGNVVYFPTWDGAFVALEYKTCQILWQINVTAVIQSFRPPSAFQAANVRPVSRTSPQIDGNVLYFGTLTHALVVAVNKYTGSILGAVQINAHPLAIITMSPTFYNGKLFVGASSVEENVPLIPGYQCCSFVGNMVALTFSGNHFRTSWNVSAISPARQREGWSGAAIWGSQPAVDASRNLVFVATGNSYSVSPATVQCQLSFVPPQVPYTLNSPSCLPSDVWQDSVIAIDLDSGRVKWVQQRPGVDIFTAACGYPNFGPQNPDICPGIPGSSSDFGMAPTFVPSSSNHHKRGGNNADKVIVGRKNGDLYALSAQDGHVLWATSTSPQGITGGLSWGIAVDDSRAYFTAINSDYKTWQLQPSGQTIARSAYGAASLATGMILWETAVPRQGFSLSPPTVVGDLVLVGRTGEDPNGTASYDASQGSLVALKKATGQVILDKTVSTNFHGGVAVQGKYVLFGTGYSGFGAPQTVPGVFHVMQVQP